MENKPRHRIPALTFKLATPRERKSKTPLASASSSSSHANKENISPFLLNQPQIELVKNSKVKRGGLARSIEVLAETKARNQ
jgi:hypothetical protein